ncbi:hypothetical protein ACROYT_G006593 [Oculina patagonica]
MITLNGTKQKCIAVFRFAMDSLDGKTSERIEVTGNKMEFATMGQPNANDLKFKYEHTQEKTFYVKPGDEYRIDVSLGDSTYCKINTEKIYKGKPGEVTAWALRFVHSSYAKLFKEKRKHGPLSMKEIMKARDHWVRSEQEKNLNLEKPGWKSVKDEKTTIQVRMAGSELDLP